MKIYIDLNNSLYSFLMIMSGVQIAADDFSIAAVCSSIFDLTIANASSFICFLAAEASSSAFFFSAFFFAAVANRSACTHDTEN